MSDYGELFKRLAAEAERYPRDRVSMNIAQNAILDPAFGLVKECVQVAAVRRRELSHEFIASFADAMFKLEVAVRQEWARHEAEYGDDE